ncbi:hypothetical protein [Kosakonia pseudosacchari]|uniref:hypothetical protein n=1 Tax=Kosakonia pseudosacchari TaxID=1646340 RepID=UPI001881929D|nr:hypothetical protein [Kosakonia pseudosacchari]QOV66463.1 hypothetical protein IP581_23740 [Kosakonia pseudosacchari]
MRIKPYWMIFPVAMSLVFFGLQQFSFGGKAFFQGLLLSIPAFVLYGVCTLLLRKVINGIHVERSRTLRNLFFTLEVILLGMIALSQLKILESESSVITFVGINTALAFVFLCVVLQSSTVNKEQGQRPETMSGNRYNPSNGLPTYSGYIDVKGNPVGSKITRS